MLLRRASDRADGEAPSELPDASQWSEVSVGERPCDTSLSSRAVDSLPPPLACSSHSSPSCGVFPPSSPSRADGKFGKHTTRALQSFLQAAGEHQGHAVDGSFGQQSKRSFQSLLKRQGYFTYHVDGDFGYVSNFVMQVWLRDEGFPCDIREGHDGIDGS